MASQTSALLRRSKWCIPPSRGPAQWGTRMCWRGPRRPVCVAGDEQVADDGAERVGGHGGADGVAVLLRPAAARRLGDRAGSSPGRSGSVVVQYVPVAQVLDQAGLLARAARTAWFRAPGPSTQARPRAGRPGAATPGRRRAGCVVSRRRRLPGCTAGASDDQAAHGVTCQQDLIHRSHAIQQIG